MTRDEVIENLKIGSEFRLSFAGEHFLLEVLSLTGKNVTLKVSVPNNPKTGTVTMKNYDLINLGSDSDSDIWLLAAAC